MDNKAFYEGIHINPTIIKSNNTIDLTYCGLLASNSPEEIYIHYGTSYLEDWANVNDIKMSKNPNGNYTANIDIPSGNNLNICFRDSGNNWDNNNGSNYIYEIKN